MKRFARLIRLPPLRMTPGMVAWLLAGLGAGLVAWMGFDAPPWAAVLAGAAVLAIPLAIRSPASFVCGGLLLVSFDRVLAVEVGPLTLKAGHVLFGYSFGGVLLSPARARLSRVFQGVPSPLLVGTGGLISVYYVATTASAYRAAGMRELVIILGGAVVPLLAILLTGVTRTSVLSALRFFVLGQALVATYALYEFAAFYLELPTLVPYFAGVGDVPRVTGFAFEPAYYAAYVVSGLPLIFSDVWHATRRIAAWLPASAVALVVLPAFLLTISRAGFVAFPLVLLGLWFLGAAEDSPGRAKFLQRVVAPLVVLFLGLGLAAAAAGFNVVEYAGERLSSIADPSEASSNAPRLQLYEAIGNVVVENPVLGIGPGALGYALRAQGLPIPPGQEHIATANNVWLEAAAEAGVATLPLTALVVLGIGFIVFRRSALEARLLALGGLLFLLVHGAFVSFFWDMKLWVVIALALVARRHLGQTSEPGVAASAEEGD